MKFTNENDKFLLNENLYKTIKVNDKKDDVMTVHEGFNQFRNSKAIYNYTSSEKMFENSEKTQTHYLGKTHLDLINRASLRKSVKRKEIYKKSVDINSNITNIKDIIYCSNLLSNSKKSISILENNHLKDKLIEGNINLYI